MFQVSIPLRLLLAFVVQVRCGKDKIKNLYLAVLYFFRKIKYRIVDFDNSYLKEECFVSFLLAMNFRTNGEKCLMIRYQHRIYETYLNLFKHCKHGSTYNSLLVRE